MQQALKGKRLDNESGKGPEHNSKCRLPGHNHLWTLCENNPKSKNYNGTHYSKIREQQNGTDSGKRSAGASKNGEVNMISGGKTVTFEADFSLESDDETTYDSDASAGSAM